MPASKPRIGVNDLASQHPDVAAEWHPTKNGALTAQDVTRGSDRKVWWQCALEPEHEWEARVKSRTANGRGCVLCSRTRVKVGVNDLASQHPDVAAEWHPTKNGTLTTQDVTRGTNRKVWWQCARNPEHEWEAVVYSRTLKDNGCPECSRVRVQVGVNDLASQHPDIAAEFHPTKNGTLTAQDIARTSQRRVWWQCARNPEHEWEMSVKWRVQRGRCPQCPKAPVQGNNDLATQHPDVAAEWHPTKNGTLTAQDVTRATDRKVWWQCARNSDHEWEARVFSRTQMGSGCPFCSGKRAQVGVNDLASQHPDVAAEWHPTKNGNLTARDLNKSSNKKVWWQCARNSDHEWEARVAARTLNESGCPLCARVQVGVNDLASQHPDVAAEWHPAKNGTLTAQDIARASNDKVWWQCARNPVHEWEASVDSRTLGGNGCPECSRRRAQVGVNDLASQRPDVAAELHPTKNGPITAEDVALMSNHIVWWQCLRVPEHEWEARVSQRTHHGTGCPWCSRKRAVN
jgi:Zn finger protein HypA/HybF involved in hydrogenase expression